MVESLLVATIAILGIFGFNKINKASASTMLDVGSEVSRISEVMEIGDAKSKEMSEFVDIESLVEDDMVTNEGSDDDAPILYPVNKFVDGNKFFNRVEFLKYDQAASESTKKKIDTIHIPELVKVRSKLGVPIIIRSAARSVEWEKKQRRSGKSQHVYNNGLGAVDVSVKDFDDKKKLDALEAALIAETKYTRITRYDTFLHADLAPNLYGKRCYYANTKYGWMYVGEIKE